VIHIPFLPADGMALFPFILIKLEHYREDELIIRHERIHLMQQLELLVVFFYLLYVFHYLFNLVRYRNHRRAYMNIVFEKEAYVMETNREYLNRRRFWEWMRYL